MPALAHHGNFQRELLCQNGEKYSLLFIPYGRLRVKISNFNIVFSLTFRMASEYVQEYPNQEPQIEEQEEDDGNTTTVQFIAVSAEEHERMVREGELPETIQGMVILIDNFLYYYECLISIFHAFRYEFCDLLFKFY